MIRIRGALRKPDILVVGDPAALTHIMQRNIYDYHHSEVVRPRLARLLGKSLAWVEGEPEHKRMREIFLSSLSPESIRNGTSDFFLVASKVESSLESHCIDKGGSVHVNILEWVNQAA